MIVTQKAFRVLVALAALSALAVLCVRTTQSDAFREYQRRGGKSGFWNWFAHDRCGISLPTPGLAGGAAADDDSEGESPAAAAAACAKRRQTLAELEKKERELMQAEEKALVEMEKKLKRTLAANRSGSSSGANRAERSFKGSSGSVRTGGKSSYRPAAPGQPYRVNGIQGIEFGSSENAPAEGAKPLLSVAYDQDGNAEFKSIKWRETRKLSDPIYGFDKAVLDHTYDSGQLSRVTLVKNFPFDEQGMRQAMEFYATMSGEASADLGFDLVDVDRTGNEKSPRICEFKNRDGDTSISGGVSVWSEKSVSVTLSVSDKGYSKLLTQQANEAYERGDNITDNARVEVWGRDYTTPKSKANDMLERSGERN